MRPLRIEIEGFSAFRQRTTVSFEDVDLFALVGPTGAGKSSIIDAIIFALYGKVPRYQDDRAVAPVINVQSNEARVRLDFELGGEAYTAVRVVQRAAKGKGASTRQARLQHGDEVLAGDARGLDEAIGNLLGLSFEQFTKTVVLPQGDFARFMHERPADRQELLIRLLDLGVYNTMAQMAREQSKEAKGRVERLDEELARLGESDPNRAAAHRCRATVLASLADQVRVLLDEIAEHDRTLVALKAEGEVTRDRQQILEKTTVPDEVAGYQGRLAQRERERAEALAALDELRIAADRSAAALHQLPDEVQVREWLRAYAKREERTAELSSIAVVLDQANAGVVAAQSQLEDAQRSSAVALAALDAATERSRAAALRHELHVGENCPVCDQVVNVLPARIEDRELVAARAAATDGQSGERAAADAHGAALRLAQQRQREHDNATRDVTELAVELADAPDKETCEQLVEQSTTIRHAERVARQQLSAGEATYRKAAATYLEVEEAGKGLRRAFTAARDHLAQFGPPAPTESDLLADWQALESWCRSEVVAINERLAELLEQHRQVRGVADSQRATLRAACEALGVDAKTPHLLEHVAQLRAQEHAAAEEADRRQQRRGEIQVEVDRHRETAQVADETARLLSATGFQQWLLEEALDELVAGASDRLRQLSSGQFSLEHDGKQFAVRDHHNADDLRSVKTLSGGETFLASLALSLALADNVAALSAAGAPRLESVFLDEGFGSLDPETLDVVAAAIEELGASGRMVGIVTHIRELADRLPVRFEVSKLADSSVVERVEPSLGEATRLREPSLGEATRLREPSLGEATRLREPSLGEATRQRPAVDGA